VPLRRRGTQARRHPERRASIPRERHVAFELLVERVLDALPPRVQRLLDDVAIVIEEEPRPEDLVEQGMPGGELLYGLYQGTPATEYGADWVPFPNKISLYRLPLEADFADPRDLAEQVRLTVLHELAHHVGMDEDRLERLGLD
jgi:predicted Zn-dependent protease with MMP-like domain